VRRTFQSANTFAVGVLKLEGQSHVLPKRLGDGESVGMARQLVLSHGAKIKRNVAREPGAVQSGGARSTNNTNKRIPTLPVIRTLCASR